MGILYGIGALALGAIIYWLFLTFKAMKDPDVQIASDLRMSIQHYRHYQKLFDEYQDFMLKHGTESVASQRKFVEIFKQIKNPNEWRRYSAYREQKQHQEHMEEIFKYLNPDC